jgi:hypothetical protein
VRGLLSSPRTLLPLLTLRERVRTCAKGLVDAVEPTLAALCVLDTPSALGTSLMPDSENTATRKEV